MEASAAEWEAFLDVLRNWWFNVTEFANNDGESEYFELDRGLSRWTGEIVDFCYDHTTVDPTPLWELYRLVDSHNGIKHAYHFQPAEMESVVSQVERCLIITDYFWRKERKLAPCPPSIANNSKLFIGRVPTNPDIVDLVARIDADTDKQRDLTEIARELTDESIGEDKKAKSLLAQVRRLQREGRLKPLREQSRERANNGSTRE